MAEDDKAVQRRLIPVTHEPLVAFTSPDPSGMFPSGCLPVCCDLPGPVEPAQQRVAVNCSRLPGGSYQQAPRAPGLWLHLTTRRSFRKRAFGSVGAAAQLTQHGTASAAGEIKAGHRTLKPGGWGLLPFVGGSAWWLFGDQNSQPGTR